MELGTPRALGSRYELLERIGTGGMGAVWRATDRQTGRPVAAKLLRSEYTSDPQIVGRFIQERSILVGLRHPRVVKVLDLVAEGDDLAIVMELVTGGDLRQHLRNHGTMAPAEAVAVTCSVLDALAAAHASRCLHRDVKPDNVLVATGDEPLADRVRLTDFGIARLAHDSTVQATGLIGTPGYMPPELFSDGRFSAASDVYAAGVMLYELLGGRTPFAGTGTAHTIGFRHVTARPPRIPVSDELWSVLDGMLGKDPSSRLTAAGTADALRELAPDALAGPPLPIQVEPEVWESAPPSASSVTRLSGGRGELVDPALDVGATHLHARQPPAAVPGTGGAGGAGVLPPPQSGRHVLQPAGETADRRRAVWPWVVAGAAVLAVVGVVGFVLTDEDDPVADPATPVTGARVAVDGTSTVWPSGLEVERAASYDPAADTTTLRLTYTAGPLGGGGSFFEAVDVADCEALAVLEGPAAVANSFRSGTDAECGVVVGDDTTELAPGDTVDVALELPGDLSGATTEELTALLDGGAAATEGALAGVQDPQLYAAQRITGLCARATPATVLAGSSAEPVVELRPEWGEGAGCDPTNVLWNSDDDDTTPLLRDIAGGADAVVIDDDACDGIRWVQAQRDFQLEYGACTLEVSVGELSTTFDLAVRQPVS